MKFYYNFLKDSKFKEDIELCWATGNANPGKEFFETEYVNGFLFEIFYKGFCLAFYKHSFPIEYLYSVLYFDNKIIKDNNENFPITEIISFIEREIEYCNKYLNLKSFS
jgi:hypothetical protein